MEIQLLPSFLVHFIIFIFMLINVPATSGADDEKFTKCGNPYLCGNITDITYPFWGDGRPQFCGPRQEFELICIDDNYTVLDYSQTQQFRVLDINTSGNTMTIAREDLWEDACPEKFFNTTLDYTLFSYPQTVQNLSIFYNCTSLQVENNFKCSVNGRESDVFYGEESHLPNYTACSNRVEVPVFRTALDELRSGNRSLQNTLNWGFDVVYNVKDSGCSACEDSGGKCGYNWTLPQFVCFCRDQPHPRLCQTSGNRFNLSELLIGIGSAVIGILLICISICCLRRKVSSNLMFFWRGKTKNDQNVEAFVRHYESLAPKRYSYSDVKKITDSFKDKLGQGGYGNVYKGKLLDGCPVAVKVLNASKGNGEEFINEVASISRTSHVNVVTLLGFCLEGHKRALIYEFMPNGSLEKFIYNESPSETGRHLGWEKLHQIGIGIAQGLEYLHRGCNTQILHFDIKPHNILLDEEFCPKISDFGLAKLCPRKVSMVSMLEARGTIGYIAPEVFSRNFGGVSHKSDVYSYGMMVLEMVGGRNSTDDGMGRTSEIYFPHWVYKRLELDNNLQFQGSMTEEENKIARKMILVGLWCIQTDSSHRPSTNEVIDMLEASIEALQIPPKPFLSSPPRSPENSSSFSIASMSY